MSSCRGRTGAAATTSRRPPRTPPTQRRIASRRAAPAPDSRRRITTTRISRYDRWRVSIRPLISTGARLACRVHRADTFSARWTGQVQPQFTGTYTFYTQSDDGVRLWVNGQQIVNNWTDHAATENSGDDRADGGQRYDIRMEFYENGGGATARLLWSSASTPKAVIPARLYPPAPRRDEDQFPACVRPGAGRVSGGRRARLRQSWQWPVLRMERRQRGKTRDRDAANSPDQRYDTLTHCRSRRTPMRSGRSPCRTVPTSSASSPATRRTSTAYSVPRPKGC